MDIPIWVVSLSIFLFVIIFGSSLAWFVTGIEIRSDKENELYEQWNSVPPSIRAKDISENLNNAISYQEYLANGLEKAQTDHEQYIERLNEDLNNAKPHPHKIKDSENNEC